MPSRTIARDPAALPPPIADRLGAGFSPVRKPGKLPSECASVSYDLEYGQATLEVHEDAFTAGHRVLVVERARVRDGTGAVGGEAQASAGRWAQRPGLGHAAQHVEGQIPVERRDLDRHHALDGLRGRQAGAGRVPGS